MKHLLVLSTVALCICILKNSAESALSKRYLNDGIGYYGGGYYPHFYGRYVPPAYGRYGGYGYYPPAYGYGYPANIYGYQYPMYPGYLPPTYKPYPPQTVSGFVQHQQGGNPNRVVSGFVQQDGTHGYLQSVGTVPQPLSPANNDVLNALFPGFVQVTTTTLPPPTTPPPPPPPPQSGLAGLVNSLVQDLVGPNGLLGNVLAPDGKSTGLLGNLLGPDGVVGKLLG